MNIAILGGSFDPPHLGHFWVARQILDYRQDIDRILLIPTYRHQWKPIVASVADRLHMVKMLEEEKIQVSTVEVDREGVSYTIDTIKQIKQETNGTVYWIVGSDILTEYSRWDKTGEILKYASFLVFPRDPYLLPEKLPEGFEAIRSPHLITSNISSTAIRTRITEGNSVTDFIPESIESYITDKKLYR